MSGDDASRPIGPILVYRLGSVPATVAPCRPIVVGGGGTGLPDLGKGAETEFAALVRRAGLTTQMAGRILGVPERTVWRLAAGAARLEDAQRLRLEALARENEAALARLKRLKRRPGVQLWPERAAAVEAVVRRELRALEERLDGELAANPSLSTGLDLMLSRAGRALRDTARERQVSGLLDGEDGAEGAWEVVRRARRRRARAAARSASAEAATPGHPRAAPRKAG